MGLRGNLLAAGLAATLLISAGSAWAAGPGEVVSELYAGFPQSDQPPGGEAIWAEGILDLWHAEFERQAKAEANGEDSMGEGLSFDFMNASQEDYIGDVDIKTLLETEGSAEVEVTLDNGGDVPVVLVYELVQEGDWKIHDVLRSGPDGWRLSDLIKQTR